MPTPPLKPTRIHSALPFTFFAVPSVRLWTSLKGTHNREETWNTEDWGRMDHRFPRWDLDAWECPQPMDRRMTRNPCKFFADIWSSAATSWIPPKSTAHTKTRNCWDVSCARYLATAWSSPPSLASVSVPTESEASVVYPRTWGVRATRAFAGWASRRSISFISIAWRSEEH